MNDTATPPRTHGARDARESTVGRRRILGLVGATGAVGALRPVEALAGGREQGPTHRKTETAYRLSTHGHRVCTACKAHAANRFYRSPKAADGDRAHPGCNCDIVTHPLAAGTYHRFFSGKSGKRDVWDRRWKPQSRSRRH